MIWSEFLTDRPLSEEEIRTACAALLAIAPDAIAVIPAITAWQADPRIKLVVEVIDVRGDCAQRLSCYVRDAALAAHTSAAAFVAHTSAAAFVAQFAGRVPCACLIADDSPHPYTWIMIHGPDRQTPVVFDPERFDEEVSILKRAC